MRTRLRSPPSLALVFAAALGGACHATPPRARPTSPGLVRGAPQRPPLPPLPPYACKVPARLAPKPLPVGPAVSGAPEVVSQRWSNAGQRPLAPSPDGALVGATLPISREGEHSIVLADTTTGEVRASWPTEAGEAQLRFSGSGALLAAIGASVVELWDTTTGARRATISVDGFGLVAFSDDESRLTILGRSRQIVTIDTASGETLEAIALPERLWSGVGAPTVGAGAPSPGGGLVAYPWGSRVVIFDVAARAVCGELELESRVDAVAFDPFAARLAVSAPGIARVWDVATGGPRATLAPRDARTRWPMWSPDGTRLALVASDHAVVHVVDEPGAAAIELARGGFQWLPDSTGGLFPTPTGMTWTDLATASSGGLALGVVAPSDASFSARAPDASAFVTRHPDGALRLWDAGATRLRALLEKEATQEDLEAFFTPDGGTVGYAAYRPGDDARGGLLKLFSAKTGAPLGALITGSADHGVPSFRADGLELAKRPADGEDAVTLYAAAPLAPTKAPWPSTFHPESVSYSPRGATMLAIGTSAGERYQAQLFGAISGPLGEPDAYTGGPVVWSPDGGIVAIPSGAGFDLFDVAKRTLIRSEPDALLSESFSSDGALLARASAGAVEIVETRTGAVARALPFPPAASIELASFRPTGGALLIVYEDERGRRLRLVDTATWATLHEETLLADEQVTFARAKARVVVIASATGLRLLRADGAGVRLDVVSLDGAATLIAEGQAGMLDGDPKALARLYRVRTSGDLRAAALRAPAAVPSVTRAGLVADLLAGKVIAAPGGK